MTDRRPAVITLSWVMLFERQKCLLALVDSLGGDVGELDSKIEQLSEQCYRHCVAEALARTFGRKFAPQHL
jgi:hypothetical protein